MSHIKQFSHFVYESQKLSVTSRPLTEDEIKSLKDLQLLIKNLLEYDLTKKDEDAYETFKTNVGGLINLPCAEPIKRYIDKIEKIKEDKPLNFDFHPLDKTYNLVLAAFKKGIISPNVKDLADLNIKAKKASQSTSIFTKEFSNPLLLSSARSFFNGKSSLVDDFDKADAKKFVETDFDKPCFTYLNLPKRLLNHFESIIYFVNSITSDQKIKEINKSDVKDYLKFVNDSDEYDELLKIIDRYLYDNDKALIPKIIEELEKYPELVKVNNDSKKELSTVYRGIGLRDEDEDESGKITKEDIIEQDKKTKYVATSLSSDAAKNFALLKGHMDRDRNSKVGYIIEYAVDPNSIVLDTTIFGSVYGESEILIDATKAKVISVKKV